MCMMTNETYSQPTDESAETCKIKGSVNDLNHVPGSTYYSRTTYVVEWFCSVEEAESAGYRSPMR